MTQAVRDDPPAPAGPAIIVATASGGVIGADGKLPWHAPEDLAHFKRLTMGHQVIIGATTWNSIGRALPGRELLVVSRRQLELPAGVRLAASPDAALVAALSEDASPLIAGGSSIYEALLDAAQRVYLTEIEVDIPGADAWFPPIDQGEWRETSTRTGTDERLTFRTLDRILGSIDR